MSNSLPVLPKPNAVLPGDLNTELIKRVEQTLARLDEIANLDDLTELRRQAQALTAYLREHDESGRAMKIAQLRIERRIGEVLARTVRPGNPKLLPEGTKGKLPSGVTRRQSSKCQKLAAVQKKLFEKYLADAKKPSLNGALRHAIQSAGSDEEGVTATYCGRNELDFIIQSGMKFRTIYADPPWPYKNQGSNGAAANQYRSMSVSDIAALPVEKLAADVSQLHLWTTNAFLEDAYGVLKAWGFEYKTLLVWEKPHFGGGNYWRLCHEFLMLGTRGGAQFPDGQRGHRSVMQADREKDHSQKPEEFRQLVEQVGKAPRLELFGRRQAPGWVVWGNEVERDRLHRGVEELLDAEEVEDDSDE